MITVDLPTRKIGFSFTHSSRETANLKRPVRLTGCGVWEIAEDKDSGERLFNVISSSVVTTYSQFSAGKEKRRKWALRRALFFTNLTRSEREMVWEAYHLRFWEAHPVDPISNEDSEPISFNESPYEVEGYGHSV